MASISAQDVAELKKQAAAGDAKAQNSLGNMYANGTGVPQNYTEAVKWYRKAANQGFADAQLNLGSAYDQGQGVARDEGAAADWFRKAADQGLSVAQYNLGIRFALGTGVMQSYGEAYFWLSVAAAGESGAERADIEKEREESISHLNQKQLAQAQDRVQKWLEKHPPKPPAP
jgi:TPR repeat protein